MLQKSDEILVDKIIHVMIEWNHKHDKLTCDKVC